MMNIFATNPPLTSTLNLESWPKQPLRASSMSAQPSTPTLHSTPRPPWWSLPSPCASSSPPSDDRSQPSCDPSRLIWHQQNESSKCMTDLLTNWLNDSQRKRMQILFGLRKSPEYEYYWGWKINRIQIWIWLLVFGFNYSNRIQMPNYAPCTHLSDAIASDPKTLSSTDPQLFHDQWPRLKVEIGLWCQGALILVLHLQHSPHFSHCHCCSVHSLFLYTFQFMIRIPFGSRIKLDSVFPPPTWAWLSRPGPVSLR